MATTKTPTMSTFIFLRSSAQPLLTLLPHIDLPSFRLRIKLRDILELEFRCPSQPGRLLHYHPEEYPPQPGHLLVEIWDRSIDIAEAADQDALCEYQCPSSQCGCASPSASDSTSVEPAVVGAGMASKKMIFWLSIRDDGDGFISVGRKDPVWAANMPAHQRGLSWKGHGHAIGRTLFHNSSGTRELCPGCSG